MLQRVLSGISTFADPNVLVGYNTADDAGVYLLDDNTALVQSVDFFTPIVDDPFDYGRIAAANALSDIYAMGGTPRFALALVGFPEGDIGEETLRQILAGGAATMKEARVAIIGGHSVKDPEIKFGYAVTGVAHPQAFFTNSQAHPGDRLILTKPIGTGVISTAIKFAKCPPGLATLAVEWMLRLNRDASRALAGHKVHAVTDITGFGLLGHGFEMALYSGVCLQIEARKVPLLDGVIELAKRGMLPGGIESNRKYVGAAVRFHNVPPDLQRLLFDPQTSGGLLVSVSADATEHLLGAFEKEGVPAWTIGAVKRREIAYLEVIGD